MRIWRPWRLCRYGRPNLLRGITNAAQRTAGGMIFYRGATALLAFVFLGIGIALLVVTAANGGGVVGYLLGLLFMALGIGRLYLLRLRKPRG